MNNLPLEMFYKTIRTTAILLLAGLVLNGCNDNNKSSKKSYSIQQKTQIYAKDTTLKGKVSNKKREKLSGEIKVTDSKGKLIAATQLQENDHYSVTIPSGTELPILLTFYADENSANKDRLISAVIYTLITKYDINELTTRIAKKAKALGGYTHTNMVLAADSTVGVPDANKTSTGFRGDPTQQYGGWH